MNQLLNPPAFQNDVTYALGKEVVQPGTIAHYHWPESDPETAAQSARPLDAADLDAVRLAGTPTTPNLDAVRKSTRAMSQAETVLFVLTRETFNFNGTSVAKEPLWQRRVAEAVAAGRPIRLVYPLIAKIGCWAKQMTNVGPSGAELACLHFFNHLNRVVKEFYAPGVTVDLVCDAFLYNSSLQLPHHEVETYVSRFTELAAEVAGDTVRMHDYCDLLRRFDAGSRRFRAAYQRQHRLVRDRMQDALVRSECDGLFDSMRALVNTRRLGLTYEDHRDLFGPDADRGNRHFGEVDRMALEAVREFVAIRMACSELNVLDAAFPDMVRVSCHRGKKSGRAVIGLRVYPEYYRSSRFLPYHGIAVIRREAGQTWMELHPEVVLRGDSRLTRVHWADGDVFCYHAPAGWEAPTLSQRPGRQAA